MRSNIKVKSQNENKGLSKISPVLLRLTRLVRSLTQAQKRDFKKYVKFWSGKGGRKYLRLFDAMCAFVQAGKKEEELLHYLLVRKKFGEKPADLSATALYLYKKILESMRTTPEHSPHLSRLYALMQDILFVYHKNLLSDCLPMIDEARLLAKALDKPALELELLFWERRARANERHRHREEYFQGQRDEERSLEERIIRFNRYNALAYELAYLLSSRDTVTESAATEVLNLLPENREGLPADVSLRLKVRLGAVLTSFYELQHTHDKYAEGSLLKMANLEKSLFFQQQILDAYRADPVFFEEEQAQYTIALEGYINRCLRLGRLDEVERHIGAITAEKDGFLFCRSVAYVQLLHHIRQNEFRQARDFIQRHQLAAALEKYKNRLLESRLLALRFTCGQAYFGLDDFAGAGDWFDQVAGMRPEIRSDVVWLGKLLTIICLYEQNVYRKEENPARPIINFGRALRRAGLLTDFLETLLEAVTLVFRNPRALTRDGLPELLTDLHKHLAQTPALRMYGMVMAWLEAKLNRSGVSVELRKYNG